MTDTQIVHNYRLDRESIYELCHELEAELARPTRRVHVLPVSLQVMIALRYFASGSYINVIGDAHGVSKMLKKKMSVSRSIHSIAKNIGLYIQFPMTNTERQSVMFNFYDIKEFPLVLGAVDGTLIPIKAPSVDEHLYVCRKGFHALIRASFCVSHCAHLSTYIFPHLFLFFISSRVRKFP